MAHKATGDEFDMIAELAVDVLNDPQFKRSGLDRKDFIQLVRKGYTKLFKYVSMATIEKYREDYPHVKIIELEEGKYFFKLKDYKLTRAEEEKLYQYEFDGKKSDKHRELNQFSETREFIYIDKNGKPKAVTPEFLNSLKIETKKAMNEFIDALDISENEKRIYRAHVRDIPSTNRQETRRAVAEYAQNFVKGYKLNAKRELKNKKNEDYDDDF